MKELKLTNHDNRPPSGHDRDLRTPSTLDRQGSVAMEDTDGMISIGGRRWSFPSAQIDGDSWEGEWRSDGKVYLHDGVGNAVEGTEVSDACCYHGCDQPGTVFIGRNGNPDSEWICEYHCDKWNADRDRFVAAGLQCDMEEL